MIIVKIALFYIFEIMQITHTVVKLFFLLIFLDFGCFSNSTYNLSKKKDAHVTWKVLTKNTEKNHIFKNFSGIRLFAASIDCI